MTDLEEYQRYITKLKLLGIEQPLKIDIDSSDNKIILMGVDENFLDIGADLEIPGFIQSIEDGRLRFKNIKRIVFHNKPDRDLNLYGVFCNINVSRIQIRFDHPERVTSLESAFQFVYRLKEVEFENLNISTVPELQNCFEACSSLQSVIFPDMNQIEYEQENRVENMAGTFNGCKSMRDYRFLEDMDLQKVRRMQSTFKENNSLVCIDLGKLNLESIEDMTNTFCFCNKLTSVIDTEESDCKTFVNLPKLKDMTHTFMNCSSLKQFNFKSFKLPSLETMYGAFCDSGIESIDFGDVELPRLINMRDCFNQCFQLQKARLAINQGNDSLIKDRKAVNMQGLFEDTPNLRQIEIPNKIVVSNIAWAFKSTGFTDLDLQNIIIKKNPFKDERFKGYLNKSCVRVLIMPKFEEYDYNGMKDFLGETLTCIKADNHWLNTVYLGRQYKEKLDKNKGTLSKEGYESLKKESEKDKVYYRLKLKVSRDVQKQLESLIDLYSDFETYIEIEYI